MVREVGAERVLFGTDSPLYSTSLHRARIESDAIRRRSFMHPSNHTLRSEFLEIRT
jgi:predicted TIM-barrel fold metal-dependent hydrolase